MMDLMKEQRAMEADVPKVTEHSYYHPNLVYGQKDERQKNFVHQAIKPLRDSTVINMFAGPGAGKSTLASGVYKELWRQGVSCELITEYAKERVWEGSIEVLEDQLNILGKQQHRQFRAGKYYRVLITDSPILLSLFYDKSPSDSFRNCVQEKHYEYDNINYYLERKKPYIPIGRYQKTIGEARKVDDSLHDVLIKHQVDLRHVPGEEKTVDLIVDDVLSKLDIKRKTDTIELPSVDELLDVNLLLEEATKSFKTCNVINFFGGPDVGKTAMAANTFFQLKSRGINCELILSYAKEKFLEGAYGVLNNQATVFGKQSHRMERVKDKVDFIITDAPLLQQLCYSKNMRDSLKRDIVECNRGYRNHNFVINRIKPYNPIGKMESIEEAKNVDEEILKVLRDNGAKFKRIF